MIMATVRQALGVEVLNASKSFGAFRALDGTLGDYVRKEITAKGLYVHPKMWENGMRQITASSKPIRSADDLAGFTIRTPAGALWVDLFKSLGASPTPIVFPELYLALQTKVVDGQETPYSTIDISNFHEVQKYLSVTNHMATIFWFLGNMDAWNALPSSMQTIVLKHAETAAILERLQHELATVGLAGQAEAKVVRKPYSAATTHNCRAAQPASRWANRQAKS